MTHSPSTPILLLPPPGPITWLFPELGGVESALRETAAFQAMGKGCRIWDLARMRFGEGGPIRALQEEAPAQVLMPGGPRGRALKNRLVPCLRGQGIAVTLLESGSWELETWLEGVAGTPGEVVTVKVGEGLQLRLLTLGVVPDVESLLQGGRPVPCFLTRREDPGAGEAVETRLDPSWWGLLPGDRYPKEVQQGVRALMRDLYPERYFQFLAYENLALAGVDVYSEAVLGRFPAGVKRPGAFQEHGPLILAIDGIDGAGKSTHLRAVKSFLESKGLDVAVHKMYRHGVFHDTVTDVTRQCTGGKNLHLWRLQRLVKAFDSVKYYFTAVEPDLARRDVLLFDRYTHTHHAAGTGRYHHDPFTREMLSVYPSPHRLYLLDLPAPEALRRIKEREERTVDENPYMLERFRHALHDMAGRCGFKVLEGLASFEENRRVILEDLENLLVQRRAGRDG